MRRSTGWPALCEPEGGGLRPGGWLAVQEGRKVPEGRPQKKGYIGPPVPEPTRGTTSTRTHPGDLNSVFVLFFVLFLLVLVLLRVVLV